ncbi:MAG: thiolase family protein [Calditrichaeota bacterium]|nr:MAG: thiolase family protein [Calditrichota bacterium]
MSRLQNVVIASAARTPIGSYGGALASVPAPRLGSVVIKAALERAGIAPNTVDKVIMGNVLSAGLGQAPARQAALFAGLPTSVSCLTINKMCGSGLKAVMLAAQAIALGDAQVVVAGGMESMSNAPYLLEKARFGYRMGDGKLVDSMIRDGLWDVYNDFHMGNAAELCARECRISREEQDEFARKSYERALKAQKEGYFKEEIVPVTVQTRKGEQVVDQDEEPSRVNFEKLPTLRPVFEKDGTVTAANASTINDGAAAVVVMSQEAAEHLNVTPMARILAYATASKEPEWFTTAPVDAIQRVLQRAELSTDDIDLYEINEAFAVVTLVANQRLRLDPEKVNISGGAVALGHPIGASGARILTTLLYNLRRTGGKLGLASLCIGGGEAVAVIVEIL